MTIKIECVLQRENLLGEIKMGIKSFHHTAISVTDLGRSIHFYSALLGMRLEWTIRDGVKATYFHDPDEIAVEFVQYS